MKKTQKKRGEREGEERGKGKRKKKDMSNQADASASRSANKNSTPCSISKLRWVVTVGRRKKARTKKGIRKSKKQYVFDLFRGRFSYVLASGLSGGIFALQKRYVLFFKI